MLRHLIIIAAVLASAAAPAAADAQKGPGMDQDPRGRLSPSEARDARQQGSVVPALRVISAVRQRYPGAEVLDAELQGGAAPRYIVRILTREGRRLDVVADARTGQLLYER
jgi:uncharacterized membrane protein YkoI